MKNRKWAQWVLSALAITLMSSMANAAAPDISGSGNGGDICENRFKIIRDDLELWIQNGGSKGLALPNELKVVDYNNTMLSQIEAAKISCTDDKVFVGRAEKTCRNFFADEGTPQIICNVNRFEQTDPSDQYVLVHHEYAGLAGFEVNDGESSNYSISNQLTGYLADKIDKKLVVKPVSQEASSYYCEALCEFKPVGYGASYILLYEEAITPVEALNKIRRSCAGYEGSYGYLYKNSFTGHPDGNWTQASVENSCRPL